MAVWAYGSVHLQTTLLERGEEWNGMMLRRQCTKAFVLKTLNETLNVCLLVSITSCLLFCLAGELPRRTERDGNWETSPDRRRRGFPSSLLRRLTRNPPGRDRHPLAQMVVVMGDVAEGEQFRDRS